MILSTDVLVSTQNVYESTLDQQRTDNKVLHLQ